MDVGWMLVGCWLDVTRNMLDGWMLDAVMVRFSDLQDLVIVCLWMFQLGWCYFRGFLDVLLNNKRWLSGVFDFFLLLNHEREMATQCDKTTGAP